MIRLFTMAWGQKHIDLFRETAFKSLHWSRNQQALKNAEWCIYTKPEHFKDLQEMFRYSPFKLNLIEIGEKIEILGIGTIPTKDLADNFLLLRGLLHQIQLGLESRTRMLFAPPDTIFGDGTIPNMIEAGRAPGSAVMVAHMRVNPSILDDIKESTSNPKLVNLGMKHIHKCWVRSESGNEEQATFKTGVIFKKVEENLWEVKHQLPTTYLVDFTPDDWQFWSGIVSFGAYDHQWPGENFIRQERQRYVGSSDACFIVEITDADKNQGEVTPKHVLNHFSEEGYFNWRLHNTHNRQHVLYFRGEP